MRKCVFCGKEFESHNRIHKYCSQKCRDRARFAKDENERKQKQQKKRQIREKAVALYDSDYSTEEIASILNCSNTLIYSAWEKAGLPKRLTQLQKSVKEFREKGLCSVEIAEILKIPVKQAYSVAKSVGMPFSDAEKQKAKGIGYQKQKQFYTKTEQENKKHVESFLEEGFSYVSGYTGCDCMITIRCEKCGHVFERSMITIRHGRKTICPECERKRIQEKENEKEKERQRLAAERKAKREQREHEKELDRIARTRIVVCEECGKTFTTTRKNQVCCSQECSRKRSNRRKDKRISKEKYIDSDITTKSLFERDNGVCWICGGKCDFDDYEIRDGVIICGDNYPSIDHVIEICNGGEHSWQNVKLAHRRCNSKRYWRKDAS